MIFGPFGFNQLKSNYLLFTIQFVSGLKPVLRFSFRPLLASSFRPDINRKSYKGLKANIRILNKSIQKILIVFLLATYLLRFTCHSCIVSQIFQSKLTFFKFLSFS